MRPSRAQWLAQMVQLVATRSTCPRLQVGALIVRDSRIISMGYNGVVSGDPHCDHPPALSCAPLAVHAEANALVFAARHGLAIEGCQLWCTHSPCYPCAQLIKNAGIGAVNYLTPYRDPYPIQWLQGRGVKVNHVPLS